MLRFEESKLYACSTHLPESHAKEGGFYTYSTQEHHDTNALILVYDYTARYITIPRFE
jgi:hypothetical protein